MTKHLHQIYQILFEEFGPQYWWPGETRDEIIIGAILTQNTNWANVEKAINNLKEKQLLTLSALTKANQMTVVECIKSAGYFNQKAERLILISKALQSYIPSRDKHEFRSFLLSLKGIGPETADSILLYAYNIPFFVVDAYTKRIFSRLGYILPSQRYSSVQQWIMQYLEPDSDLFNEYHALIVKLAKTKCKKRPMCSSCPLKDLCRYAMNSVLWIL